MIETMNKQGDMAGMPSVGGLLGRFMLEKEIGKGSLGSVYLAHDTLLDVRVALKVISPSLAKTEAFSRLAREVLMARKVSHPGICRIFDIHEVNQYLFISMEYIEGPTLEDLIRHSGVLPIDRSARIISYVARSLAAAHAQGVIHRGLTPSNLVVRAQDRVSIMDFGQALARDMASNKSDFSNDSSLVFMSPEILTGQQATQASDIYSLGAILYRCVTGAYPFQGDNAGAINDAVLSGNIVPPHLFNPQVGQSLENVIIKSMHVRPANRYHSVLDFKKWIKAATGEDAAPEQSVAMVEEAGPQSMGAVEIMQGSGDEFDSVDDHTQQVLMEDVTILFSDIVAITKFFDKFGDMAGRKRIQKHNQLLFPVIQRHRGKVIKTIGDAIMAYFALPEDAVEAAIDMQQELEKQNATLVDEDSQIHIRIGLHSGPCIVEDQDVFGDAVNVASRVCGQTAGGEILISADTRSKLVRNKQYTEFFSDTMLKGKSEEYSLYIVKWRGLNLPDSLLPLPEEDHGNIQRNSPSSPLSAFSSPPVSISENDSIDGLSSSPPDLSSVEQSRPLELYPDPVPQAGPESSHEPALYIPDTENSVEATVDVNVSSQSIQSTQSAGSQMTPEMPDTTAVVSRATRSPSVRHVKLLFLFPMAIIFVLAVTLFAIKYWPGTNDNQTDDSSVDNPIDGKLRPGQGQHGTLTTNTSIKKADQGVTGTSLSSEQDSKGTDGSKDSLDVALVPLVKPTHGSVTSKSAGLRSSNASPSDVRRLEKSILASMKKKGILVGDSRVLAVELKKMKSFLGSKNYTKAMLAGRRAKTLLDAQKIDRKFIKAKLLRFNKAFDKVSDSPEAQKVMDLAQDIMSSVESGNYNHANTLLNRSFKMIQSAKR